MSAAIDSMLYVGEKPWHNLGRQYQPEELQTVRDIITGAGLDWKVDIEKMKSDSFNDIPNYHVVYREDNNNILAVLNKARPELVQNEVALNTFEELLHREVEVETAASLGLGERVFTCFKINEGYTILDDAIDHYFVVVNDHTKSDGRVTVFNTPIRVVCQNTLSSALAKSIYQLRVPITDNISYNMEMARNVIRGKQEAEQYLERNAKKLYDKKITRDHIEAMLDELFPMNVGDTPDGLYSKANQRMEMMRERFIEECLGNANLGNFRGTQYQVYNALTDWSQHYYSQLDKSYDLNYRMGIIPGLGDGSRDLAAKYLKIKDKIIA